MNYTPNPVRGCGRKKRGGFYLEAGLSPFGTLNAVTYCLGSGVEAGENLILDISARGVWLGDLAPALSVVSLSISMISGLRRKTRPIGTPRCWAR